MGDGKRGIDKANRLDSLQRFHSDPANSAQLADRCEWSVLFSILHNSPRQDRSDTGQQREFSRLGTVQIDLDQGSCRIAGYLAQRRGIGMLKPRRPMPTAEDQPGQCERTDDRNHDLQRAAVEMRLDVYGWHHPYPRKVFVMNDYAQVTADATLENDLRALVRLSIAEDLRGALDWTTVCLIDRERRGACQIVPRQSGICAGLATLGWIIDEFDADLEQESLMDDGQRLVPGEPIASLRGNTRDLLTSERTILNIISRLCGIATQTGRYVDAIASTGARLYDTRKTTPGWRLLEKYAVGCGGGHNHRSGLYDGFLIKDNHLALAGEPNRPLAPSEAAEKAISWRGAQLEQLTAPSIVEIEVDSIAQLHDALRVDPDIVLLDNFSLDQLREAVSIRDASRSSAELEASGNVTIDTIAAIAETGVERISSGALTHQATSLDLGLDWMDTSAS